MNNNYILTMLDFAYYRSTEQVDFFGVWKSWNWHSLPLNYTFASCVLTSRSLTHNCNVFCVTNSCNSPIITLCCPTAHRFSYQEAAAKSWTPGLDLPSGRASLPHSFCTLLVLCSALYGFFNHMSRYKWDNAKTATICGLLYLNSYDLTLICSEISNIKY